MFKLEGVINSWNCCFKFLNRSIPIFPKECVIIKPKEQKLLKVTAPFIGEISGLANCQNSRCEYPQDHADKIKLTHNTAMLGIVNNGTEAIIFWPEEIIGIVDLRLLVYYKIKQGILQQNLCKYYRFERAETL